MFQGRDWAHDLGKCRPPQAALTVCWQTLALEYAERGIRVNAVAPGAIATPMNMAWIDDETKRQEVCSTICDVLCRLAQWPEWSWSSGMLSHPNGPPWIVRGDRCSVRVPCFRGCELHYWTDSLCMYVCTCWCNLVV